MSGNLKNNSMRWKKENLIGQVFLDYGYITEKQLEEALKEQKHNKKLLGQILIERGYITERELAIVLSKHLNIPYVSINPELVDTEMGEELRRMIPEDIIRSNLILPINKEGDRITVAMVDPFQYELIDNLKRMTRCEIIPVVATSTEIKNAIDLIFGKRDLLKEMINDTYIETSAVDVGEAVSEELSLDKLIASAEEAPVVKLVDLILNEAIESRATDIHIEPFPRYLRIRYRIDGILYEISPPAKHMYLSIVSRIKILAKMDIAEKRLPQDGAFVVKKGNRLIDIRVSTVPTVYGEKVVMRILNREQVPLELEHLGFGERELGIYKGYIKRRMGLILLTGPTGCGKTTTLYATLNRIKSPEKNIITIEDPVEYKLDGINQVEVKPHIGLTFAKGLRAFLRQDPDVIMVGEVRDLETAQICIRASLTGHLVLSTVHTNDSASAITRLIDIGIEPYLVSSSLIMVVAQRLLRRLCNNCKEPYVETTKRVRELGLQSKELYIAKGCNECRMTGYKGQIGIFEVLPVTDKIKDMIHTNPLPHKIKQVAKSEGMLTLMESAMKLVERGVTSIEEALRVTAGMG